MSLDVYLKCEHCGSSRYSRNITHNLGVMAKHAGIYKALWRPEEIGVGKPSQLIPILEEGLKELESRPDYYKTFNPENGWGDYSGLVEFVREYLAACRELENQQLTVEASR